MLPLSIWPTTPPTYLTFEDEFSEPTYAEVLSAEDPLESIFSLAATQPTLGFPAMPPVPLKLSLVTPYELSTVTFSTFAALQEESIVPSDDAFTDTGDHANPTKPPAIQFASGVLLDGLASYALIVEFFATVKLSLVTLTSTEE